MRRCTTAILIGAPNTTNTTIIDIQVVLVVAELFGRQGLMRLVL